MIRSTAVRLGIPVRQLALRILIPFGLLLLVVVGLLSFLATNSLNERASFEQQVTVKTLFETQASVHSSRSGLAILSQNRGYERVWVLSATGDILDSNKNSDIGTQLDNRWWRLLKDEKSGFIQEEIDFGSQRLALTALHHAEMGRWVVIVSKPQSTLTLTILYSGLILVIGLILWMLTAALIWGTLSRKIAHPIQKLDDRAIDLIRGTDMSEAALDRLLAETLPSLGGHADCMVDLARGVRSSQDARKEAKAGFEQLFNSIPSFAFIASQTGAIQLANKAIANRMGVEPSWIEGQSVHMLKGIAPVNHLERWFSKESASKVGIERIELFPTSADELESPILLSIQPMLYRKKASYLVLIDEMPVGPSGEVPVHQDSKPAPAPDRSRANGNGAVSFESAQPLTPATNHKQSNSDRLPHKGVNASVPSEEESPQTNLLEGLMEATGQFVVVFDEQAQTVFWSPTARTITGLAKEDISDMKEFTEKVFTSRQERKLFKTWIDGEPDERSQELKIKTPDGVLTSRWYASEIEASTKGSVGVLWAELDTPFMRKRKVGREPAAQ